jgi:hypothetical protein
MAEGRERFERRQVNPVQAINRSRGCRTPYLEKGIKKNNRKREQREGPMK